MELQSIRDELRDLRIEQVEGTPDEPIEGVTFNIEGIIANTINAERISINPEPIIASAGNTDAPNNHAGRITTGTITMRDLEPNAFTIDERFTISAANVNTTTWGNNLYTTSTSWSPQKAYKFDKEKVNNTVAAIRVIQAIMDKYSFSKREVERLGIQDLVIED
jgi:hypothetical protein